MLPAPGLQDDDPWLSALGALPAKHLARLDMARRGCPGPPPAILKYLRDEVLVRCLGFLSLKQR